MKKIIKTDREWQQILPHDVYLVSRQGATEMPFSGELYDCKEDGIYLCACCGAELFDSLAKFDSGTGWPSFFDLIDPDNIIEKEDTTHGMQRIEVRCSQCDAHLGHLFPDGPEPTHLRYCINSLSLKFQNREKNR